MEITLQNIRKIQSENNLSVIKRRRVTGNNTVPRYFLCDDLEIILSDGTYILIPYGFTWDLSSVPRFLWSLLPPDSDAEMGIIIHDYLYINKLTSREFADKEMLIWSR